MSAILARLVKRVAEGGFGAGPAKAYWALAGKKTWIAAGVALAGSALEIGERFGICGQLGWDCAGWSAGLFTISGFLAAIGLYDGAVRSEPPLRLGLRD